MNRAEAEDYIYESYLLAEKEWEFHAKDAQKRKPVFSKEIIDSLNTTPAVNITGSKGKGSVAKMISQILSSAMTVGLMTSPHIVDFNERFRVGKDQIRDDEFIDCVEKTRDLFAKVQVQLEKGECISPIGIQCVIALLFFGDKATDINIFEGGKGVKYDDVNNIVHDYAVINTIFLEHTRELGDSIEEIAEDKACIITGHEKCVYVAEQRAEVQEIIARRARKLCVPMKVYGQDFYAESIQFTTEGMQFDVVVGQQRYRDICIPLLGEHQAKNCALALALCADIMDVSEGWGNIQRNLRHLEWPGRMEIISNTPFILLDACINRESAYNVKKIIRSLKLEQVTCIVGIPDDKDYLGVVSVMAELSKHIILTKSSNRHYVFTDVQKECVLKSFKNSNSKLPVTQTQEIGAAIRLAQKEEGPIVILGTTSLIADVKRMDVARVIGNV